MPIDAKQRAAGRWLVFAATVLWASTATLARFVFRDRHVPALTVVQLRVTIAAFVFLVLLVTRRREALKIRRADIPYFLILGLFGIAALQASYYYSISKLGVGLAILIQYLAPTLIVAFDLVRGRWVGWTMIAAVASATFGTLLLVGGIGPEARNALPIHWVIVFTSAFIWAFYIVYSKRGLERYAPETVLFYTFSTAAIFWAIVLPPTRLLHAGYSGSLWAIFLVIGLFSTLAPFWLFYSGLRWLPAAEASVIATAEPLVAILLAGAFLHEQLHTLQFVGAGLVLLASVLASRDRPRITEAVVERG